MGIIDFLNWIWLGFIRDLQREAVDDFGGLVRRDVGGAEAHLRHHIVYEDLRHGPDHPGQIQPHGMQKGVVQWKGVTLNGLNQSLLEQAAQCPLEGGGVHLRFSGDLIEALAFVDHQQQSDHVRVQRDRL